MTARASRVAWGRPLRPASSGQEPPRVLTEVTADRPLVAAGRP